MLFPTDEGGNAARFFHLCFFVVWFSSLAVFGKVILFLGWVCAINFRERTLVFALFLGPCVFGVDLPMVFAYFLAISPRKCFQKILLMSGLVFCLVFSVLGFGLMTFFCCPSSFSFFLEEIKLRVNRTPHTPPPRVFCFFLFLSPPLCLDRLFWPCVLYCSGASSGCHSGPRALFGFSRDCSEAFFWTRGGKGVCSILFVVFSRSVVFAPSHVSSGPCRPAGGLARSLCPSEGKGSIALLGRRDSDPLLFVFSCVASVCFGSQGPKSPSVRLGASLAPRRFSHAHLFPQVSLFSLSLSLFLSFAACQDAVLRECPVTPLSYKLLPPPPFHGCSMG